VSETLEIIKETYLDWFNSRGKKVVSGGTDLDKVNSQRMLGSQCENPVSTIFFP
jgi:hypothetical protein